MVKIFVPKHNHELATGNHIAFVCAHRHVSNTALALTNTMTSVSIRPCHTYEYMVEQAGGYSVVGFTMKDLYNTLNQQRQTSPFESDSEGALSYMRALVEKYPHFICRFTTDLEDRLVDIFWRDGHSFVDYQCYGDVLIFDSIYKTNVYNMPLVLFVGTNNHRGSIIFGAALISDETEETYTWLLRRFLESMNGKMLKAVLTDSDKAMHKAIQTMMLEARHCLCIWHIGKNAFTHLKSEEKLKAFYRCVRTQTVEQFDRMFQYRAVPCRHMFTVMKNEHIFELHNSLIVKIWSKDARTVCEIPYPDQSMPIEALEVSRHGALSAECNRLSFYASKTDAGYNLLRKEISRLSSIVEGFAKEKEKFQAPATPSNMKGIGHNRQTCNVRKEKEKAEKSNENDERNTGPRPSVATLAKRSCDYCKRSRHNTQRCDVRKEKEKAEKINENVAGTSNDPPPLVVTPVKRTIHCST
ncbi:hypothetical protein ACLB2K_031591 [Fragaria x ananassa]